MNQSKQLDRARGLLYLVQSALNDWKMNEGNITVYSIDALGELIDAVCDILGDLEVDDERGAGA